jgi:hypothetical protein
MITVLACFLAALFAGATEPPGFDIESLKPGEVVRDGWIKVTLSEGAVVFDIHDARGIGGVRITPKSCGWPKPVVVRLHLRGLESLQISSGKFTLFGSVLTHSDHRRVLEIDEAGQRREAGKDDPFWINIRTVDAQGRDTDHLPDPEKGGYFEVTLPPALLNADTLGMTLRWIDFFRQ